VIFPIAYDLRMCMRVPVMTRFFRGIDSLVDDAISEEDQLVNADSMHVLRNDLNRRLFLCDRADNPSSADDDESAENGDSDYSDDSNVGRRGWSSSKPFRSSTRPRRPKRYGDFGEIYSSVFCLFSSVAVVFERLKT
jgi:hypothetical protein